MRVAGSVRLGWVGEGAGSVRGVGLVCLFMLPCGAICCALCCSVPGADQDLLTSGCVGHSELL